MWERKHGFSGRETKNTLISLGERRRGFYQKNKKHIFLLNALVNTLILLANISPMREARFANVSKLWQLLALA
jgi:hypothetical protein